MTGNLFPDSVPSKTSDGGWYTAHCDGGSRGNPGPAGFGAVITDPAGQTVARLSRYLGAQTNNYAEYQGLLAVLEWADQNGVGRLRVVSDSELMVKQMKGIYKVKHPALQPLWQQARQLAARLDAFDIRHTLREGNKEADRLANEAMDQGSGKRKIDSAAASSTSAVKSSAGKQAQPKQAGQVTSGFVKNGVVHPLEGELPEGKFVKIIWD